jgi:4-hydroxy-2-oxoheptanedioate aldolase
VNKLEFEMIECLKKLKNDFGVFEIKCEFEAEASRMEELMRLKDVTSTVGLPMILKTGGVEAVTDMYNALAIGVKSIIAPMAETPFALQKFLNSIKNFIPEDNADDIEFAFNMETITAYNNIDEMLDLPDVKTHLQAMTIGRVDFCGSMSKDRAFCDGDEMYEMCEKSFIKARERGLGTGLGGAISTNSVEFIKNLNSKKLIDKFETRKVVFRPESIELGEKAILAAVEFELLWLKSKRRYYSRVKAEDESRIEMLDKRFNN